MIDQVLSVIDPTQYINNAISFFFPHNSQDDDLVLTKDEKSLIVKQIEDMTTHLNSAKRLVKEENFDGAINEVEKAIDATTCPRCQKKMIVSGFEMSHADNVCQLDEKKCETLMENIIDDIDDFIDNYLPKVEEVLKARES